MQGKGPFYIVAGNVATVGKNMEVPLQLKIELPYDLALPVLGQHLEKTIIGKETYTPVFITTLSTIDRTRKQPTCQS